MGGSKHEIAIAFVESVLQTLHDHKIIFFFVMLCDKFCSSRVAAIYNRHCDYGFFNRKKRSENEKINKIALLAALVCCTFLHSVALFYMQEKRRMRNFIMHNFVIHASHRDTLLSDSLEAPSNLWVKKDDIKSRGVNLEIKNIV